MALALQTGPSVTQRRRGSATAAAGSAKGDIAVDSRPERARRGVEHSLLRLVLGDECQSQVEYALIGAFVSVVAVVAIQTLGPLVHDLFKAIRAAFLF